jgi:hypothetical protein
MLPLVYVACSLLSCRYGTSRLRAVTHHQVKPSEIDVSVLTAVQCCFGCTDDSVRACRRRLVACEMVNVTCLPWLHDVLVQIVVEAFERICNEAPRVAPPTPPAPAAH